MWPSDHNKEAIVVVSANRLKVCGKMQSLGQQTLEDGTREGGYVDKHTELGKVTTLPVATSW